MQCRLELYKNSFFPSTTAIWNSLPDYAKTIRTIPQFKQFLSRDDTVIPKFYYSNNRFAEIIHCKLRLEISDLKSAFFKRHLSEDKSCLCGYFDENARHFLLECPRYDYIRTATINTIQNFNILNFRCFTHGKPNSTTVYNENIFKKVQEFIILSKRFDNL